MVYKKYSNQDTRILVELASERNMNISENSGKIDRPTWNKYFNGKEINGNVTIKKELLIDKPSKVEVTLTGIEYSFAHIYNTIAEI